MTIETTSTPNEPIVPTSPPAKRIKTDSAANNSASETMDSSNGAFKQQQELQQPPPLLIKKLSDKARLPTRGSAFAAGYDLYAARATTIPARGKVLVDTDISMSLPAGTCTPPSSPSFLVILAIVVVMPRMLTGCLRHRINTDGRVAPRSGLASKHFIDTGAGVIDADYRGHVKVLLFNHGEVDYEVQEGDRIAQLIVERIYTPEVVEVAELEESVRGAGGFGSTGTN